MAALLALPSLRERDLLRRAWTRERLTMTHALVAEAPCRELGLGPLLVILDESFAALDPDNQALALECAFERAPTLLVIAHP